MEAPYHTAQPASHGGDSRPSLGFPLGTALLLVVIFSLSGIFSCCYHWDKLRRSLQSQHAAADLGPSKPKTPLMNLKRQETQSLPVIMPGDNVPKFIALPCPSEQPREGEITDSNVHKPPPKPPHMAVPLHLYSMCIYLDHTELSLF